MITGGWSRSGKRGASTGITMNFSRECGHVEPLVLTRAWRPLAEDPVAKVLKLHPEAAVDEVQANGWHTSISEVWLRREEML